MSALAKALVAAQSEFPPIERSKDVRVQTKSGGSYSFSYAPLDAILHAVRPVLTKHGLAVSQLLGHVNGQPALKTVLLHEGGEVIEDACPLPVNVSLSAQEFGSLVTYFRRYALVTVLGIATEEDDDGNAASGNRSSAAGSRPGTDDLGSAGSAADAAAKAREAYERSGGRTTPFSKARPDMTDEEFDALYVIATQPGALPSQQVVHFGPTNKGVLLGELEPGSLKWLANDWKVQENPTDYDIRLKRAAVALLSGNDTPDFDVPFQ